MTSSQRRNSFLLAAVLFAAALYFSPHWAIYRMRAALQSRDATAFSSYVDFPALKESFKGQLLIKLDRVMDTAEMKDNPFAGLGQLIGAGLVSQMVETFVSPAGIMVMMQQGQPLVERPGQSPRPMPREGMKPPAYALNYVDWSTVAVQAKSGEPGKFILKRDGLLQWKLSAVEIPL